MKIDEFLLDRMRNVLKSKSVAWEEKRMFGGVCFMVDDKMCFGTFRDGMMARVHPDAMPELTKKKGAEQMTMGPSKRVMKGFLQIDPDAYDLDDDLEFWIEKALEFNPLAQKSKKKRKK